MLDHMSSKLTGSALAKPLLSGNASGSHSLDVLGTQEGNSWVTMGPLALLSTIKVTGFPQYRL